MTPYFLQLGHCPELSIAEIRMVRNRWNDSIATLEDVGGNAIVECESPDSIAAFCMELGGVIRAAEVLHHDPSWMAKGDVEAVSQSLIEVMKNAQIDRLLCEKNKRPIFGLSLYSDLPAGISHRQGHSLLHAVAGLMKDRLRELDTSSRFVLPEVPGESLCLGGAQVDKNKILQDGMEIGVHFQETQGIFLLKTIWLQPYEEFSQRDYGRPSRDARSGMLPPKLARMLINLARTKQTVTLLDPFCGSGGILTEAGMMGLQATGFDTSEIAVRDTMDNWSWISNNVESAQGMVRALVGDARKLHTLCEPLYFDVCVTEPFLGPPLRKPLTQEQFNAQSEQLLPLYLRALGEIRTVVKPGGRVVFVAPRFRLSEKGEYGNIPLLSEIKLQGYRILDPGNGFVPSRGRSTLIYSRPKQYIQREIFVLEA